MNPGAAPTSALPGPVTRRTAWIAAGAALVALGTACAQPASAPPPSPVVSVDTVTIERVDTVRVETAAAANPELEDRVARLQIQLLERDVQLRELQEQLEATRVEPVGEERGWIGQVHRRTDVALGYGLRPREAAVVRGMVLAPVGERFSKGRCPQATSE